MVPLQEFSSVPPEVLEAAGGGKLTTVLPRRDFVRSGPNQRLGFATKYFKDEAAPIPGLPYAYFTDRSGWIIFSAGPNQKYEITDPGKVYSGAASEAGQVEALIPYTYDPSNGTYSPGDVWSIAQ